MKDKIQQFFNGRCGMDELNRVLLIGGLLGILFSGLCGGILNGVPAVLFRWFGLMCLIYFGIRVFSRDLYKRQAENAGFLQLLQRKKSELEAAKERRKQRKQYVFFKCPGCKKWLRVPRGKGKIHINCRCGYMLYRKT